MFGREKQPISTDDACGVHPAAMASTLTTTDVGGSVRRAPGNSARWHQRLFFTGMPIAMTVAVFVGFAPTYYSKTAYGTPVLKPLYHLHGLLFSLWMAFLVAQPALVAARRINVHRRLGTVGGVLAAVMVLTALVVAVESGRRGAAPPGVPPLSFLAVPLATVIVFPALIGAALAFRRQPEMHKRLMLIGTLELLPAGIARWPGLATGGPLAYFGFTDLFLVAIVLFDLTTRGRPHPATIWADCSWSRRRCCGWSSAARDDGAPLPVGWLDRGERSERASRGERHAIRLICNA